uniref:Uncharacterized protein n=1 Tax=Panagrolaimus sp. PS1159 TaxID=55785 RepID=A0AC35F167_9BILA
MFFRITIFIVAFAFASGSANRYSEYLEECVTSYKNVITQVCPSSSDPLMPCLSDDVLQRYNNDSTLALIKLGFQCCDSSCNQLDIVRLSCCDEPACYRRCKGKPVKAPSEGKAAAFRRLRQINRDAAVAYANAETFNDF